MHTIVALMICLHLVLQGSETSSTHYEVSSELSVCLDISISLLCFFGLLLLGDDRLTEAPRSSVGRGWQYLAKEWGTQTKVHA